MGGCGVSLGGSGAGVYVGGGTGVYVGSGVICKEDGATVDSGYPASHAPGSPGHSPCSPGSFHPPANSLSPSSPHAAVSVPHPAPHGSSPPPAPHGSSPPHPPASAHGSSPPPVSAHPPSSPPHPPASAHGSNEPYSMRALMAFATFYLCGFCTYRTPYQSRHGGNSVSRSSTRQRGCPASHRDGWQQGVAALPGGSSSVSPARCA